MYDYRTLATMTLKQYLSGTGETISGFARRLGVSHATVSRLVHGHNGPSGMLAKKIMIVTDGKVTPLDFEYRTAGRAA